MSKAGDLITRMYGGFRGVDFRGEEVHITRSPDALNVWRDYRETESIRTRPKMDLQKAFTEPVWGVYFFNGQMLVHSGKTLYRVSEEARKATLIGESANADPIVSLEIPNMLSCDHISIKCSGQNGAKIQYWDGVSATYQLANLSSSNAPGFTDNEITLEIGKGVCSINGETIITSEVIGSGDKHYLKLVGMADYQVYVFERETYTEALYEGLLEQKSNAFAYENAWYFKDGKHYLKYDGETIADVVGYVPTTTIARKPLGGGEPHEDVNMLSNRRKNSFLGDGVSKDYYLDTMSIDDDFVPIISIDEVKLTEKSFTVDYQNGIIHFGIAPPKPLTDGQDNVLIEFKKTMEAQEGDILACTLLQVFDNRVFFSGNKNKPNMIWHCSLDDPSYCSDTDFYKEGLDSAAVRGMVAGNNALWVFREPSSANTTVFYHTPVIDEEYGKIYPSVHSSVTTGCIGGAINFGDDIVFFSDRGMEGISGDVTTEQVLGHRSTLVDRKLLSADGYRDMVLCEWEGYLLIFIGKKCFLADSRASYQNGNHMEYDFFYWEMDMEITSAVVEGGVLYLGSEDGVYALNDYEGNVKSHWVTPKDKFNNPNKLKTTNKRGCVAEAMGDISVYAKLEDTDFEHIGTYEDVTDYFVSRIKRKKWKDIQLKFASDTRFSLETVTLEAFVGGYIKR